MSMDSDSGLAKRRRRLGKKDGLFNFDQKGRGVTERGMRKGVVGPLWPLLLADKKGSSGWFWERKSKAYILDLFWPRGDQERDEVRGRLLFFLVEIKKFLGLSVCTSFKIFLFLKIIT